VDLFAKAVTSRLTGEHWHVQRQLGFLCPQRQCWRGFAPQAGIGATQAPASPAQQ
jgi:hypothetical protein